MFPLSDGHKTNYQRKKMKKFGGPANSQAYTGLS